MKNNEIYIYCTKEKVNESNRIDFINKRFCFIINVSQQRAFVIYMLMEVDRYTRDLVKYQGYWFYVYNPSTASLEEFDSFPDAYDYVMSLTQQVYKINKKLDYKRRL